MEIGATLVYNINYIDFDCKLYVNYSTYDRTYIGKVYGGDYFRTGKYPEIYWMKGFPWYVETV